LTLIELRDFVKWFARDTLSMVRFGALGLFHVVFRGPIELAQAHIEEFSRDTSNAWMALTIGSVLSFFVALLATLLTAMFTDITRAQLHVWIGNVSLTVLAIILVYSVILFIGHKINRFRRERQHLLDTLTDD
jgi:hypothetical protein